MNIETVFNVEGENYSIKGHSQEAATTALQSFPDKTVKLKGFLIDGEFKPADLSSHWERIAAFKSLPKS